MAILKNVLIVVQIIVSLVLTTVVLMQSGKEAGLSGSIAGGAETFFGKNKARTIDGMLSRLTTVLAILFIVISFVLSLIIK
ncbi:preprotein translocase subunit SecG [Qingrenia yutianensis]|uniref:preprotein translocase subunit SecG n=1 Tax=Qingrenia yutianensis TaxID=2763676 RepID=UPI0021E4FA01|nr:preprotein translocase subunit SecG [Qingrenia yutianensis]